MLTALAIGCLLINATKSQICSRPSSIDTYLGEWASAYFQPQAIVSIGQGEGFFKQEILFQCTLALNKLS